MAVSPESTVFEGQVRGLGDLCVEGSSLSGHAVGRGCLWDPAAPAQTQLLPLLPCGRGEGCEALLSSRFLIADCSDSPHTVLPGDRTVPPDSEGAPQKQRRYCLTRKARSAKSYGKCTATVDREPAGLVLSLPTFFSRRERKIQVSFERKLTP